MKRASFGGLGVRITGGTDGEGGGDGPLVVLLHGFGAPGDDLVGLARALRAPAGTRFAFPEDLLDLGAMAAGARAWWFLDFEERRRRQALGIPRDPNEIPAGLDEARAAVDAVLDELVATLKPPPGALVLGGFSQGAMLSTDVALRSTRPLAGLVLLSSTHVAGREWERGLAGRAGLPIFMSHGREDDVLPFAPAEALGRLLDARGLPVEWVPFAGGHGIPPRVVEGVSGFLQRVLAKA